MASCGENEWNDSVFDISEDLVASPQHKQAGISKSGFDGRLCPPLRLHEDPTNGCGGQLWPAGMTLCHYLLHEPRLASCANKSMSVLYYAMSQ